VDITQNSEYFLVLWLCK